MFDLVSMPHAPIQNEFQFEKKLNKRLHAILYKSISNECKREPVKIKKRRKKTEFKQKNSTEKKKKTKWKRILYVEVSNIKMPHEIVRRHTIVA